MTVSATSPGTRQADGAATRLVGRLWRPAANLLVVAVAVVFPLVFTNQAITYIAVNTLIFVVAAAAWNIFSGLTGYISLGHVVFWGSGAYFAAIASRDWGLSGYPAFWLLPLAGLVGAAIAVPFGFLALRVRRHTFVVLTIAVFFIFQLTAYNLAITGGPAGLLTPSFNFPVATLWDPFYYVALVIAVGTVAASWLIRRSRYGLQLRAIRDDEDRARGLGVRAMRAKLGAFVLSAVPVAMAGVLWYYVSIIVDPPDGFDPLRDLTIALMAFLGGLGTVTGPVLGALLIEPAQLYFFPQVGASYVYLIAYGALFLLVILGLPRGIIPTAAELLANWRARQSQRSAASPDEDGGTDAEIASGSRAAIRAGERP